MNIQHDYEDSFLKQHLNPEMIEKAPEGFTDKVMTRINLEVKPLKVSERLPTRSMVPLISLIAALILISVTFILPPGNNESMILPGMKTIHNLVSSVLKINLDTVFRYNLPHWLPYLFISILFLTIFDRGLKGLFRREK